MIKPTGPAIATLFAGLLMSTAVFAHSGASGIVKHRMNAMSTIGKNMKAIAAMMKGEAAFDAKAVKAAARDIAGHSRKIPGLFPEGSNKKPSEASPIIWSQWADCAEIAARMEKNADALAYAADAATTPADIHQPLMSLGGSCKACHEKFRLAK